MNLIQLKQEGVSASPKGLQPEILLAIIIAQSVWIAHFPGIPLVITSITDGKHGENSLHYVGLAIDLRTRNLPEDNSEAIAGRALKDALGKDYDVIVHNTHIHIEFDPK